MARLPQKVKCATCDRMIYPRPQVPGRDGMCQGCLMNGTLHPRTCRECGQPFETKDFLACPDCRGLPKVNT